MSRVCLRRSKASMKIELRWAAGVLQHFEARFKQ